MAIANCGGLILDGSTLKMVNGIITVADGNPTSGVVANCGGVKFDATYFKKVGDVITDKKESSVEAMVVAQSGCGGLLLDSKHFAVTDGSLVFDKVDSGRLLSFESLYLVQPYFFRIVSSLLFISIVSPSFLT